MELICLIGMFISPGITLGAVLIHYNHPILGIIAILGTLFSSSSKE